MYRPLPDAVEISSLVFKKRLVVRQFNLAIQNLQRHMYKSSKYPNNMLKFKKNESTEHP